MYRHLETALPHLKTITIDRRFLYSSMRLWIRSGNIATWASANIESSSTMVPLAKRFLPKISTAEPRSVNVPAPYTVRVKATTQRRINGAPRGTRTFLSIVINEIEGFVMIPQAWAPSTLSSLAVVFEESIELPATKVYESTSGWAVAKYDPGLIQGAIERATFNNVEYHPGDKIIIHALSGGRRTPCAIHTTVRYVEPLTNEYHSDVFYHPVHMELLHLQHSTSCTPGVLLNDTGQVVALWLPFLQRDDGLPTFAGVPISLLGSELDQLQRGTLPQERRILNVLLERVSSNDAAAFGVHEGMEIIAWM